MNHHDLLPDIAPARQFFDSSIRSAPNPPKFLGSGAGKQLGRTGGLDDRRFFFTNPGPGKGNPAEDGAGLGGANAVPVT